MRISGVLSAYRPSLPAGEQVEDFANWLRRDQPGRLVLNSWRPTQLRWSCSLSLMTSTSGSQNGKASGSCSRLPAVRSVVLPPSLGRAAGHAGQAQHGDLDRKGYDRLSNI
jgi:hypothetical protein